MSSKVNSVPLVRTAFLIPLLIFLAALDVGCGKQERLPKNPSLTQASIEIKTFHTNSLGWGYDIYRNSRVYVHQPIIPAINGNRGFAVQKDAQKVAELVVSKIRKNIIPPTITIEELELLKVLK